MAGSVQTELWEEGFRAQVLDCGRYARVAGKLLNDSIGTKNML